MIRDPPWRITDWQSQKREKLKYISRSAILKYGQERGDDWKRLIGTYYSILPQCNRKIKNLNTALYSIALEKQLLEKYTKNIFAYLVLCDKFHIMNHLCVTSVIDYYLSVVIIWKIQSVVVELINEKSIERKLIVAVTRIRENYIKFTKSFYRTKKKVLFNVLA